MGGTHRKKGKSKKEDEVVLSEKDLDRFAGSSDEEEDEKANKDSDDHIDAADDDQRTKQGSNVKSNIQVETNVQDIEPKNSVKRHTQKDENIDNDDDSGVQADADDEEEDDNDKDEVSNDESSQSSDSDDNLDETGAYSSGAKGMASAMIRILGTTKATETAHTKTTTAKKQQLPNPSETTSNVVVLSKTKTPLQRMAEQEKQQERQMREKRRLNRERHLAAMHTPLSVATTAHTATAGSKSVAKELELERMHRRVATRGVVALFNAIAQHQKGGIQQQQQQTNVVTAACTANTSGKNTSSKMDVKKMTKHSFLDMIKNKAVSQADTGEDDSEIKKKTNPPAKWNALRDDYMLDSKKQWDEDENNSDDVGNNDNIDEQPIDYSTDDDGGVVGAGIEHENAHKRKPSEGKKRSGKKKQRV